MDPQPPGNHLQTPADFLVVCQGQGDSPGLSTLEILDKSKTFSLVFEIKITLRDFLRTLVFFTVVDSTYLESSY